MERLINHPLSKKEEAFINSYRLQEVSLNDSLVKFNVNILVNYFYKCKSI